MRHSRRRVMKEHWELYMKKHVLNGRYHRRNMQLVMCFVLFVVLTAGCITIGSSLSSNDNEKENIDVKEALFGSTQIDEKKVDNQTEEDIQDTEAVLAQDTESTEVLVTEAETTEAIVDVAMAEETVEEEPSLFDDRCIANVEDELNIRKEPNAESDFVGSMESGAIAIVEGTEGEWTKIKSGEVEGYVLSQYVLTGEVAEAFAKDYVILHGTVLENGVNIRTEKSTTSDIVTILDKDAVVTVLEDPTAQEEVSSHVVTEVQDETESADNTVEGKKTETENGTVDEVASENTADDVVWLTVRLEDGQEGYVSADYVDIDELYQVAVSKEELERQAAEEEAARKAAEEEAARQAAAEARQTTSTSSSNRNNSASTSYQGNSITPITVAQAGESLGTFTITAYCGCPLCSSGSNRTASGTIPTQGRTIAADTSVLPYGTQVVIGGAVYTVEDCGSGVRGNHIDIFFATHEQAVAFGRRTMQVFKY